MSHKSRPQCVRTTCLLLLQCLLPASVASVGLSAHTSRQTAPVRQQKAASAIHLSKTFFRVIPVAEVQAGGTRHSEHTSWRSHTKKTHRDAGDKKCHGRRCLYIVRAEWRIALADGWFELRSEHQVLSVPRLSSQETTRHRECLLWAPLNPYHKRYNVVR